jgi:hypothetical protein
MSDSLNATVIVSVLVLTISAKFVLEELLDDEVEPKLPALVLDPVEEPEELVPELVLELEALLLLDETVSPAERLSRDTIVPAVGE